MPLTNFGSILNFAEKIETEDSEFYNSAAKSSTKLKELFSSFSDNCKKNVKTVQRIRRENVTEMILEGIKDFNRAPYLIEYQDPSGLNYEQILNRAIELEERAFSYYIDGSKKIKVLSEVSHALKTLSKKRNAHLKKLKE